MSATEQEIRTTPAEIRRTQLAFAAIGFIAGLAAGICLALGVLGMRFWVG